MKHALLIPALLFATSIGMSAVAQEPIDPAAEKKLSVLPQFKSIDENEDGLINAQESEVLAETLEEEHRVAIEFAEIDDNRDGMIDEREYVAYDGVLSEQLGIV